MASLRNLAIGVLRLRGHRNIAAALRRNARDPTRLLPLLASPAHEPDLPARCRGAACVIATTHWAARAPGATS